MRGLLEGLPDSIVGARRDGTIVFAANLSPVPRHNYRLGRPRSGKWVEALNTDSTYYGGSDVGNLGGVTAEPMGWHSQPFSAEVTLPPLGALWLVPEAQGLAKELPRRLELATFVAEPAEHQ